MTTIDTIEPTVSVTADPAPGPGRRVERSAGQAGGTLILLELILSFELFGSGDWTGRQVAAVTAALLFTIAAIHNLANWIRSERQSALQAVTVMAEATPSA
jgi:hypothetical protein